MTQLNIAIPDELKSRIKAAAIRQNKTLSLFCEEALNAYLVSHFISPIPDNDRDQLDPDLWGDS